MEKEYDYRTALVKLVGDGTGFVMNPIKVNNDTITRITTHDGTLELYNGSLKYETESVSEDMLMAAFCVILAIRTEITEQILEINKELLALGGYDTRYYKPKNWRKSFATYNINRLKETLEDYKLQLKRRKKWHSKDTAKIKERKGLYQVYPTLEALYRTQEI